MMAAMTAMPKKVVEEAEVEQPADEVPFRLLWAMKPEAMMGTAPDVVDEAVPP